MLFRFLHAFLFEHGCVRLFVTVPHRNGGHLDWEVSDG